MGHDADRQRISTCRERDQLPAGIPAAVLQREGRRREFRRIGAVIGTLTHDFDDQGASSTPAQPEGRVDAGRREGVRRSRAVPG